MQALSNPKNSARNRLEPLGNQSLDIARRACLKHRETASLLHYTGIVTLHGWARLGEYLAERGDRAVLDEALEALGPFQGGMADFRCNFPNYQAGGNAAAYLWWRGLLPESEAEMLRAHAERLMREAPRDRRGILCHPRAPEQEIVWIDVAFAVTPFLLFCGLADGREDWIDEAWAQTKKMVELLRVEATGLVNQSVNHGGPGHRSLDHWSRGNGWAMLALTELAQFFPADHAERAAVERMFCDLVEACLRFQDAESGLWHQEMTAPESYLETSGSGLLLYGIGAGIERGLLTEDRHREAFLRGLRGLLGFIALEGSIHQTCIGCLSPGAGTREDYIRHPHRVNDRHAFGPVALAFGQALRLGVKAV